MRADAHELMDSGHAADDRVVANRHVARHLRVARENDVAADVAVVPQVHVRHDPVVVADRRDARVLHRARMDCGELANRVAIADHEPGGLVFVLHVLRSATDRRIVTNAVFFANGRMTFNHAVRTDRRTRADRHVRANNGIRPDFNRFVELCARLDDCSGVNPAHAPSLLIPLRYLDATAAILA